MIKLNLSALKLLFMFFPFVLSALSEDSLARDHIVGAEESFEIPGSLSEPSLEDQGFVSQPTPKSLAVPVDRLLTLLANEPIFKQWCEFVELSGLASAKQNVLINYLAQVLLHTSDYKSSLQDLSVEYFKNLHQDLVLQFQILRNILQRSSSVGNPEPEAFDKDGFGRLVEQIKSSKGRTGLEINASLAKQEAEFFKYSKELFAVSGSERAKKVGQFLLRPFKGFFGDFRKICGGCMLLALAYSVVYLSRQGISKVEAAGEALRADVKVAGDALRADIRTVGAKFEIVGQRFYLLPRPNVPHLAGNSSSGSLGFLPKIYGGVFSNVWDSLDRVGLRIQLPLAFVQVRPSGVVRVAKGLGRVLHLT